jgi:hypothetical protein
MKPWIDQHLRRGLDNYQIDLLQSADDIRTLRSELDVGLSDVSWIEDDSHIFRTLFYSDNFKCVRFHFPDVPFQAHLVLELVRHADSVGRQIYSEMNMGNWWWGTQDQLPAQATFVPVICASDMNHLINFSGDQDAWPLYLTLGNIRKYICRSPQMHACILVGLIPCPLTAAQKFVAAWPSAVGTVLFQLRHFDLTGRGMKWDCADGFQRQSYPLLAPWDRDHLEEVIIAQVSYGSYPMCHIPKDAPMWHSTFRLLDNLRDQHIYSKLLEDNHIDALLTLSVHPISHQFWKYPLCNIYRLWQPNELHQLLLGLVKDLLHWRLEYLKARNVKDQFDNQFTSVPRYPGLQHSFKPFDSLRSGTLQGNEICGLIRRLAVDCAPILVCPTDDRKTAAETAFDEMVIG